jgi:hypothetical protein
MRGARYVRLIPWTLHSGSEHMGYYIVRVPILLPPYLGFPRSLQISLSLTFEQLWLRWSHSGSTGPALVRMEPLWP